MERADWDTIGTRCVVTQPTISKGYRYQAKDRHNRLGALGKHGVVDLPATKFLKLVGRNIPGAPVIPTPEEEDFFAALGVPCWPPQERTVQQLIKYLKQ